MGCDDASASEALTSCGFIVGMVLMSQGLLRGASGTQRGVTLKIANFISP